MLRRIVTRYLAAGTATLNLEWVEKLRKDFLTLMKNAPKVKDYQTAHRLRDALRVYRQRFEELFFNRFLNHDLKYEYERYGIDESYAQYYDKKLRSPAWSFMSELGNMPIGFSDEYHSEAALFIRYEQEAPKWANRVKTKAQAFWLQLRNVLQDFQRRNRELSVKTKDRDQVVIEGFRVTISDYNEGDKIDREGLDVFKEGLRIYKRNAAARFPRLLKEQLPLIFECEANLDKAGTYNHDGTITFYATGIINETPARAAHVLAHEMGHHMWRLIGAKAQEFWMTAIRGDYGDIDLETLLERWPSDQWAFEFVKYMADKDPVLALQVDTVSHEGVSRGLDKKEDFQRLLDNGQKTLKVPKTPISGYAGKNTEEAFCEAVGLLVAYGPRALHERVRNWLSIILEGDVKMASIAERVAARYKQKKVTEEGNVVYTYSERQVALRNAEKAKRIAKLEKALGKIRSSVKRDLRSEDPEKKLTALAVALMDHTFERVGNDESAEERGHFGVTGWQRGHVSFGKGKATINYTGKSGVKQKKVVSDGAILRALRDAYEGVEGDDSCLFAWEGGQVTAEQVNAYLKPFGVTAKDIRGFHANDEMRSQLRAARKGALPEDRKERKAQLKEEFKKALEATAKAVGHEASTLRSQYLIPGLEEAFLKDGTVED